MNGLDEAARRFGDLLDQLGANYAILGGLAVRVHAIPRPTFDVDFTAILSRDELPKLYQAAEQLGFVVPAAQLSGWVDLVHGLPVVKFQWPLENRSIDVDVFLAETAFQRQIIERRVRFGAEGWVSWFVTPEDLILLKLLANRPKDRADIADIVFIQGSLDEAYMRTWAERLGVLKALQEALAQKSQ